MYELMRPRVRVATTGVPPRSRRKAAQGTRATAILALCAKAEGENREFLRDLEGPLLKRESLGPGLGFGEPLLKEEEKDEALADVEMYGRNNRGCSSGGIIFARLQYFTLLVSLRTVGLCAQF